MYKLLLVLLFIVNIAMGQQRVIDIGDRRNLPHSVYDSLKSNKVILCGEIHGTNESPEFVEGLVRLWVESGENIILALEIDESQQPFVDQFLTTGDFSIIQKMPHFTGNDKDGRSSLAMASLLNNLYGVKNLKVVFISPDPTRYTTVKKNENQAIANNPNYINGLSVDSLMAVNIVNTMNDNPGYKLILLADNQHSRLTIKESYGRKYRTMGFYLMQDPILRKKTMALNIVCQSGKAWSNTKEGSGEHDIFVDNLSYAKYSRSNNFLYLEPVLDEKGFYGILFSRYMTASPPLNK